MAFDLHKVSTHLAACGADVDYVHDVWHAHNIEREMRAGLQALKDMALACEPGQPLFSEGESRKRAREIGERIYKRSQGVGDWDVRATWYAFFWWLNLDEARRVRQPFPKAWTRALEQAWDGIGTWRG